MKKISLFALGMLLSTSFAFSQEKVAVKKSSNKKRNSQATQVAPPPPEGSKQGSALTPQPMPQPNVMNAQAAPDPAHPQQAPLPLPMTQTMPRPLVKDANGVPIPQPPPIPVPMRQPQAPNSPQPVPGGAPHKKIMNKDGTAVVPPPKGHAGVPPVKGEAPKLIAAVPDATPVRANMPQANAPRPYMPELDLIQPGPNAGIFEFNEETHDFGVVPEGNPVECDFHFKNTGKEPITIKEAHASCGCTIPTYPKEPIAPGNSADVHVVFNTKGRLGVIKKEITITSNAKQQPMTLHIAGEVKEMH